MQKVLGDNGLPLSREEVLRPPKSGKWTVKYKTRLVLGLNVALVSIVDVMSLGFSQEEITSMLSRHERFGERGLKANSLQAVTERPRRAAGRANHLGTRRWWDT